MRVFYARVSSKEQNDARQTEYAKDKGFDKIYTDKASGGNADRPGLKAMLENIREGDTITVYSIDRLGRNVKDIINIVDTIKSKGATLECISPKFNTSDMFGNFFLVILASIAEMERNQILERQQQGIRVAKLMGRYTGRIPKKLDNFEGVYNQWLDGRISMEQAAKLLDVSRSTFYRRVKKYQASEVIDLSDDNNTDNITK